MITREKKIGLGTTIFFESTDKNVYLPDNKQKKNPSRQTDPCSVPNHTPQKLSMQTAH